jgi:hypothetical protein
MTIHVPLTISPASSTDFTLEGEGRQLVHFKDRGRLARLATGDGEIFARHDLVRWGAPLALAAEGLVALHASAVHKDGITVGFLGIGGAGKSTLAWELGRRGWEPIADDLMICDAEGRANALAEGVLRQWCNDQAAKIDASTWIDYSDLSRLLCDPHHQRWFPVGGLWFLDESRGRGFAIRALSGGDHFRRLVQYGFGGLPMPAAWAHQFQVYAALAGRVPAAILQVPEGLDELRSALPQLEDNLCRWLNGSSLVRI